MRPPRARRQRAAGPARQAASTGQRAVADALRAAAAPDRNERQREEEEPDRAGGEPDAAAVVAAPPAGRPRRRVPRRDEAQAPAPMRAVERSRREHGADGEVGELDLPADAAERPLSIR